MESFFLKQTTFQQWICFFIHEIPFIPKQLKNVKNKLSWEVLLNDIHQVFNDTIVCTDWIFLYKHLYKYLPYG